MIILTVFSIVLGSLFVISMVIKYHDTWRVTHYCACAKCCGKYADGHFASGKEVYVGGVACNWLPFGTKLRVTDGRVVNIYTVEDRGAKSIFGDKDTHRKALDIYCSTHSEAKGLGVKYLKVEVLR